MRRSQKIAIAITIFWEAVTLMLPPEFGIPLAVIGLVLLWWAINPAQVAHVIGRLPKPLASAGMSIISAAHRYLDQETTFQQILSVQTDGGQPPLEIGRYETVKFHREILDHGTNFKVDTLTIERHGLYRFDVLINFSSWDCDANHYEFILNTSNHQFSEIFSSDQLGHRLPLSLSFDVDMDAGDTAIFQIMQSSGNPISIIKDGSYMRVYLAK